jgi:hypothetical protein
MPMNDHRELVIWLEQAGQHPQSEDWYQLQARSFAVHAGDDDPLVKWLRNPARESKSKAWFTEQADASRKVMLAICSYNQAERDYFASSNSCMTFTHFHELPMARFPTRRS